MKKNKIKLIVMIVLGVLMVSLLVFFVIYRKNISIKENTLNYIESKGLEVYKNSDIFDTAYLKSIGCSDVLFASGERYSITVWTFENKTNASKFFESEKDVQKENSEDVKVFEQKVLSEKEKKDLSVREFRKVVSEMADDNNVVYNYHYMVRIKNYYIDVYSSITEDNLKDMQQIKDELNKALGI